MSCAGLCGAQGYTQYGGLRPFGVSLLYAGWDAQNKYQLYQSDPSGNYGGWKATAIGANQQVWLLDAHVILAPPACPGIQPEHGCLESKAPRLTRSDAGVRRLASLAAALAALSRREHAV